MSFRKGEDMKKLFMLLLILTIAVFAFSSCSKQENKKEDNTSKVENKIEVSKETIEKSSEEKSEENKTKAVDFTLKDKDGNDINLSDYKGKIIFLNFFTTWCTYCRKELPDLEELSLEYGDDVEFLLVDVYTSENISVEEVYKWYDDFNYTMPMVADVDGTVIETYPVQGFPTTYVIDKDFNVMGYLPGMITKEDGKNIIEGILKK